MSFPPPSEPGSTRGGDGEDASVSRAAVSDDPDAPDTDPLPTLNPWAPRWDARPAADVGPAAGSAPERRDRHRPSSPDSFTFPAPASRPNLRVPLIMVGALAGLVIIAGTTFWLFNRSSSEPGDSDAAAPTAVTTSVTTTTAIARDARAEAQLMTMLPVGYPPGSCNAVDPRSGTLAVVNCTNNSEAGGPTGATYMLARDKVALDAALTAAVKPEETVVCPGNIQSPGPWRRNAAPDQVAGILVCGMRANVPTVGWTDEGRMLVSVVRADPPGPTLEQLYQWWSTHS